MTLIDDGVLPGDTAGVHRRLVKRDDVLPYRVERREQHYQAVMAHDVDSDEGCARQACQETNPSARDIGVVTRSTGIGGRAFRIATCPLSGQARQRARLIKLLKAAFVDAPMSG